MTFGRIAEFVGRVVVFGGAVLTIALLARAIGQTVGIGMRGAAGRMDPGFVLSILGGMVPNVVLMSALLLGYACTRMSAARPVARRIALTLGITVIAAFTAFAVLAWRIGVVG